MRASYESENGGENRRKEKKCGRRAKIFLHLEIRFLASSIRHANIIVSARRTIAFARISKYKVGMLHPSHDCAYQ